MDEAGLVADGSQLGRQLTAVSLQVVFLLFNVASYHRCILSTVDFRGAFLNVEFKPTDTPIYLKINKDVVPPIRQDPNTLPYVSANGGVYTPA